MVASARQSLADPFPALGLDGTETFSITGVLGSVSTALDDFLTSPAIARQIAADVTGPVFTFGGIEGVVTAEDVAGGRPALAKRRAAELTAPDHERVLQQAALLQIFDERGGGLVGVTALAHQTVRKSFA